jgi:hypothetical protein
MLCDKKFNDVAISHVALENALIETSRSDPLIPIGHLDREM